MPDPAPRPTYRTIAREAGVSPVTVSLCFHNHPSIPESTRERVRNVAKAQGYQLDPKIGKLMHHLRMRRRKNLSSNLVTLRIKSDKPEHYASQIFSGALERAQSLGYGLETITLEEPPLSSNRLEKILRARGVEGLILLPMPPTDLTTRLNWANFSVIATSHSILQPHFNTVVPNQLSNMMRLCQKLTERGVDRIGVVTTELHDRRVNHRFALGYLWHTLQGSTAMIPPLVVKTLPGDGRELTQWIAQHQPRVIITGSSGVMHGIQQALPRTVSKGIDFVCTGLESQIDDEWGVFENPQEIGRAAVDLLAGMIQLGERGIPAFPRCMEIEGVVTVPPGKAQKEQLQEP